MLHDSRSLQRTGSDGQLQVLAPYLLDSVLVAHKSNAFLAMMALSAYDLYPEQQWNYVFGLASYSKRVSVSSLYRFQPELQPERNFDMSFFRLIKTASHEIGHMFGLHHCLHAQCVMNGSNSLSELDRTPARLCSSCLQKLQHSVGFNIKKRTTELIEFARSKQLKAAQIDLENDWILLSQ